MFIRNSLTFAFCVCFIYIKFCGLSVQGADRLDGNEVESCFIDETQQKGICKEWNKCEMPCSAVRVDPLPCTGENELFCCPITSKHSSISASKCHQYKEYACNTFSIGNKPHGELTSKTSTCVTSWTPAILTGKEALPREFPHMALVGYDNGTAKQLICGGTLISDRFVLSAAHCFHNKNSSEIFVRLGEHDRSDVNQTSRIDVKVANFTIPEDYDIKYEYNDIALIQLADKVEFNPAIRPACLPQESITYNQPATATGWGLISASEQSKVLMKVSLRVFDHNRCKSRYPIIHYRPQWIREYSQFCAGSLTSMSNTCSGDSGGPLQIMHKSHHCTYTIIGVISFGQPCEHPNSVGLYTNVFHYLRWIEGIVWPGENITEN